VTGFSISFADVPTSAFGAGRAPMVLAVVAGVITAFNPCGFAMLPAYVAYFVGHNSSQANATVGLAARLTRAGVTGGIVTAGFMTVFGGIGLVANQILTQITRTIPYISMGVGVVLAFLGIAMMRGFEPKLSFLKVTRARKGSGLRAMYLYGVSYAVVSLSCGFAGFSTTVISAANQRGTFNAMRVYFAFSAGMGLVLVILSIAIALAQDAFFRGMRRLIPHVNRASGVLLVLAGSYVAYYGYYEWQTVLRGKSISAGPVGWVQDRSSDLVRFFNATSSGGLVVVLTATIAMLSASVVVARRRSSVVVAHETSQDAASSAAPLVSPESRQTMKRVLPDA
jgi:cytochrome c-type biogenesis protein